MFGIFFHFFFFLAFFFSFPSLLFSSPSSCFLLRYCKRARAARTEQQPPSLPLQWPPGAPLAAPPLLPSPMSSSYRLTWSSNSGHGRLPWRALTKAIFLSGMIKMEAHNPPLLSPSSILSKTISNHQILWDFIFQLNSNFISNSNLNPSGLLLRPYISLGAPPPCFPMSILPQNQILAVTQVPPHHRCLSPPPPLFQIPPCWNLGGLLLPCYLGSPNFI
jgi:hypothetical protein